MKFFLLLTTSKIGSSLEVSIFLFRFFFEVQRDHPSGAEKSWLEPFPFQIWSGMTRPIFRTWRYRHRKWRHRKTRRWCRTTTGNCLAATTTPTATTSAAASRWSASLPAETGRRRRHRPSPRWPGTRVSGSYPGAATSAATTVWTGASHPDRTWTRSRRNQDKTVNRWKLWLDLNLGPLSAKFTSESRASQLTDPRTISFFTIYALLYCCSDSSLSVC